MKKVFALLLLTSASYAMLPPQPNHCPDVAMIQDVGLSDNLARDSYGKWYAGRTSQAYGTNANWTFVIGNIFANDKVEALAQAYEALSTLKFDSGPMPAPSDKWLCLYTDNEGLPAGAISPPITTLLMYNY